MAIKAGKKVPNFKIPIEDGRNISLKDFAGKNLVIFFYPKDDTPGCTKEACGFRDENKKFNKKNTFIIGISKDSLKRHQKFIDKYDLNFTLASDEESNICEKFDVWKEKSMYGKKYMGIERSTFLIDSKGILIREWRKVKVKNHVEEVLAEVNNL
ncbi:MAG: thioredoxin-dependent thiol peroxidase [Alphaproteobacteria bacterium TMED87]|mgnify:CR=1 FL=1|nr:thioredoxin-dependent thiol peroxidase [Rhodospirillaceae bacterium]OUV08394.1 MAG: thioredoxin-dependent thiol peroxidase [Alphaproteobacteria bacterium TMED87]|tara:strand:+ start:447 stop:911 length:465 start_codon:yes stop_codon:yes gene_type:complete